MVINHICPIQALAIGAAEPWDFLNIFFWSGPYPALGRARRSVSHFNTAMNTINTSNISKQ